MVNSKKKGNHWENVWANWLKDSGIRAWKDGASGGGIIEKSDVGNDIDYSFQVKAVKKLSLQEAWRQAKRDAALVQDIPCVVVHFDGMAEDEFLVVMNNKDWLAEITAKRVATESKRLPAWKFKKLKDAVNDILREY